MIVVAGGDSFVWGSELADCYAKQHSQHTWPALLARQLDGYCCLAAPGVGNEYISRQVINYCEQNKNQQHFVVVQWTFPNRYEFKFSFNTEQRDLWYTIGAWNLIDDVNQIEKEYHSKDQHTLQLQKAHLDRAKRTGVTAFAQQYFKDVGSTEYWETYITLKEIVYLQNYLKLNNIPFLFACADNCILHNFTISSADATVNSLCQQIDHSCWAWFPAGAHNGETQQPRGFYQWAMENKYSMGTTHPLESAHADAADIIKGKFNELVEKHIQQNSIRNSIS